MNVQALEGHRNAALSGRVSDPVDALLIGGIGQLAERRRRQSAVHHVERGVAALVVLDLVALPRVGLVGLRVNVEVLLRRHDEPRVLLAFPAQNGQDSVVGTGPVADQDEVVHGLHVEVLDLQGDDRTLTPGSRNRVQTLQTSGIISGVILTGQHLGVFGGHQLTAASLGLGPPRGAEAGLLHAAVAPKLDDHEVGGRDEGLRGVGRVRAGERGDVGGGFDGSAAAQDLDGVKVSLGVEL